MNIFDGFHGFGLDNLAFGDLAEEDQSGDESARRKVDIETPTPAVMKSAYAPKRKPKRVVLVEVSQRLGWSSACPCWRTGSAKLSHMFHRPRRKLNEILTSCTASTHRPSRAQEHRRAAKYPDKFQSKMDVWQVAPRQQ